MSGMEIVNGGQFRANMEAHKRALARDIQIINRKTALDIKRAATVMTPVRSGALRKGWDMETVTPWEYIVQNVTTNQNDVLYGVYVEFGTRKMAGRHMLTNACAIYAPIRRKQIQAAMRRVG